MEARFGFDLEPVRVHTGARAGDSAAQVNAAAYTVGHDVVLGAAERSDGVAGTELLEHEIAHTIQQRPQATRPPETAGDDHHGTAAIPGRPVTGVGLARAPVSPGDYADEQLVREFTAAGRRLAAIGVREAREQRSHPDREAAMTWRAQLLAELRLRGIDPPVPVSEPESPTTLEERPLPPRSLGGSVSFADADPDELRDEVERIDVWLNTHPDLAPDDFKHLRREGQRWHAELTRVRALEANWAAYLRHLDEVWSREDDTRARMRAVPQWSRYLTREEFDELLRRHPSFRHGTYARYLKYYTTEPKGFNIQTSDIGEVAGRPISAANRRDYARQANRARLDALGDELFAAPIRDTLLGGGAFGRIVQVGFALTESYNTGVGVGEAVTGTRSGADVRGLLGADDDVGRKLSVPERLGRVGSAALSVGLGAWSGRSPDPSSVTPPRPSRPEVAAISRPARATVAPKPHAPAPSEPRPSAAAGPRSPTPSPPHRTATPRSPAPAAPATRRRRKGGSPDPPRRRRHRDRERRREADRRLRREAEAEEARFVEPASGPARPRPGRRRPPVPAPTRADVVERARRQAEVLRDRALRGEMTHLSERRKRRLVNRYERLLRQAGLEVWHRNRLKGDFDEALRTPVAARATGRAQSQYLAGGPRLPGQQRRGTAIPDYPTASAGGRRHVNLKSDRLHHLRRSEAVSRARRYTDQAVRNARALPEGEGVVLRYLDSPDPAVQQAMNQVHFRAGSPIVEVHYGTRVHRNPHR